jgi:3-oxoacyl-[acyl-carrier protein] reductase
VIVGGSSGIGRATCQALKDKYQVINMSRRKNNEVENIYVDVENYESVKDSFSFCIEKYGKPSILVYSAGWVQPEGLLEIEPETWHKTLDTCLSGAFYTTKSFVKVCDKLRNPKIVYIASTAGTRSQPGWVAYSSAKAGIINFGLTMSEELKSYGIRVYVISPGRCATELRKKLAPNEDPESIMQPYEPASFIKYLLENGQLLDGQNLIVRGNH